MLKFRNQIAGVALLCMALNSAALTLGRLHGAALIGRPLSISVQAQLDAGADATSKCFDAELFHADARQDASQIRIAVEPTKQVNTYEVRIVSSVAVDEPVVTLNLHYVCGEKISRLYVLLADPPDQAAVSSNPPALALPATPAEAIKPDLTPLSAESGSLPGMESAASAKVPLSSVKKTAIVRPRPPAGRRARTRRHAHHHAPASSKPTASARKPKTERSVAQPRLKLDKLELLSDRNENLDAPMTLATPEKALIDEQKMQTLEGEVRALRDSAARNERSLADLKVRLQQAEAERSPGAVIYILLALTICSLSALAWLWIRQRRGSRLDHGWWSDSAVKPVAVDSAYAPVSDVSPARPDLDQAHDSSASRVAAHSFDLGDSAFSDLMPTDAATPDKADSPGLPTRDVRNLNSGAIVELRRRAENLVARGSPEQAVSILRRQISESVEPNPLVYLDLLGLLHALNLKQDFQLFSEDFNLLFNVRAPEFAVFKSEGKDLESHPDVLAHICAWWPRPKVLGLIESCIFRDPWTSSSEPFDLAAMRDLLLLHGIAQSVAFDGRALDDADTVVTSSPSSSRGAQPDLFGQKKEPPKALDLDLSDTGIVASSVKQQPAVDIDLDLLLPGAQKAHDPTLLDMELPEMPANGGSRGRSLG